MSERYRALTRALGCPDAGNALELHVDPADAARIATRLERSGVGADRDVLVVAPGASFGSSKLWPPEHFARACDELARRRGLVPALTAAPGERAIAREVAAHMHERGVVLADPPLDLGTLKALIARSRLVLTNDTGPRHIAVALDRPVVVLLGPTDPRHTAQHLAGQRVLREPVNCSPCQRRTCPIDHRCMTRLLPSRAVAAAEELLNRQGF
jgi:heptosyltransferase-2